MRPLIILPLLLISSCSASIEADNIERREHGLFYIKGTNELVDGTSTRKVNGKIVETQSYQKGKLVGPFFLYDFNGKVVSNGFGIEIKKYEKKIGDIDLSNCILSIVQVNKGINYATLYMDNVGLFNDTNKLVVLAKCIYNDYFGEYKIHELLIIDNNHEYSISEKALNNPNFIMDTVSKSNPIKISFH